MSQFSMGPAIFGPDFFNLWTQPALWPIARSKLDSIHVMYDDLFPDAQSGQPGRFQNLINAGAFQRMNEWGMKWAVELWPLVLSAAYRGHDVLPDQIQMITQAIENVEAQGGHISYVRIQWGLNYGLTGAGGYLGSSLYTIDQMADDMATQCAAILALDPTIQFRDQEPLYTTVPWHPPGFWGPALWDEWLTELATRGVQLVSLDADTDSYTYPGFTQNYIGAKAACDAHGVIFGAELGPQTRPFSNDQQYFEGALEAAQDYRAAIGEPDRWFSHYWAHLTLPLNLPETAPYSHTRLINVVADAAVPTAPVASFAAPVQIPETHTMQFTDTSA